MCSIHTAEKRNGFIQARWRSRSQPIAPLGTTHGVKGRAGPNGCGHWSCGTTPERQQKRLTNNTGDFSAQKVALP